MLIHVLQWFVTKPIATLANGFLLISDFNAILVSVAILLLCIVIDTVCRNIVIDRRSIDPGQKWYNHVCSLSKGGCSSE